jgi:hypothetical protein
MLAHHFIVSLPSAFLGSDRRRVYLSMGSVTDCCGLFHDRNAKPPGLARRPDCCRRFPIRMIRCDDDNGARRGVGFGRLVSAAFRP